MECDIQLPVLQTTSFEVQLSEEWGLLSDLLTAQGSVLLNVFQCEIEAKQFGILSYYLDVDFSEQALK